MRSIHGAAMKKRDALIDAYRYLCVRGARKFRRDGLDRADLEQVAAIGLIKAADRYDVKTGTPFEAFAWLLIIGELMHYVRDHERMVRPPRDARTLERRAHDAHDRLTAGLGREPTRAELAKDLGVAPASVDELARVKAAAGYVPLTSIDGDRLAAVSGFEDRVALGDAIGTLSQCERTIIVGLYACGLTQIELGKRLRYSQRHVSRLHRRALDKIAQALA
jgi:RNA polymerase sigma-B factor